MPLSDSTLEKRAHPKASFLLISGRGFKTFSAHGIFYQHYQRLPPPTEYPFLRHCTPSERKLWQVDRPACPTHKLTNYQHVKTAAIKTRWKTQLKLIQYHNNDTLLVLTYSLSWKACNYFEVHSYLFGQYLFPSCSSNQTQVHLEREKLVAFKLQL